MPVSEDIFRIFEAALIFFLIFFSFLKQHLLTLDETLSFLEAKGLPDSPCLPFSGPGFSHVTEGAAWGIGGSSLCLSPAKESLSTAIGACLSVFWSYLLKLELSKKVAYLPKAVCEVSVEDFTHSFSNFISERAENCARHSCLWRPPWAGRHPLEGGAPSLQAWGINSAGGLWN